jgi:hypothetical protein
MSTEKNTESMEARIARILGTLPVRAASEARNGLSREEASAKLLGLLEVHGYAIPVAALRDAGFCNSATVHPPYWTGTNPGAKVLHGFGLRANLNVKRGVLAVGKVA